MLRLKRLARLMWRILALSSVILWSIGRLVWVREYRRGGAVGRAHWLQATCRSALVAIGVRVESRGEVAHGAMIVANHLGYLDVLVLSALTPVVFVSKREVRSWPVFGWFAARAGTRFIDRGRRGDVVRIAEELSPLIAVGLTVVVFLEGTSSDGRQVLPFKSSLLEPAIQGGWNIIPAALGYTVPPGHSVEQEVCWWGTMTLPPHLLNLLALPWVEARVGWGGRVAAIGERKALAQSLQGEVTTLKAKL